MITLKVEGVEKQYPKGVTFEEVVREYQDKYDNQIALVCYNGKIRELFKKANRDGEVRFFTMKDAIGQKAYARTATMMLLKAVFDTEGSVLAQKCRVEFTVGPGYYVTAGDFTITPEFVEKVKVRMQELVELKMPMIKKSYDLEEAMELFRECGMEDKEKLFHYRRSSFVNI